LKLTAKLNPISEIESSIMSQFILGMSTRLPKFFLQTRVFVEISKLGYFGPKKLENQFFFCTFGRQVGLFGEKNVELSVDTVAEFMGIKLG